MSQIFTHFYNEETAIGAESHFYHELVLPDVTICSDFPFKSEAHSMSIADYLNITFR